MNSKTLHALIVKSIYASALFFSGIVVCASSYLSSNEMEAIAIDNNDNRVVVAGPGENKFLSNSSSKKFFDAIDKAREILEDDSELVQKVPSCVVVGMQSVGKSAILSRISGIPFPQDSEVCTRVATELRLRRVPDADKIISINAANFDKTFKIVLDTNSNVEIEEALKQAQKLVLKGQTFEDKISVKVEKADVDLPDVTLIDLPGIFFAKDQWAVNLENRVKDMVQERIDNDMALIMHVVPLNQDTDTISTWRTVRDADEMQKRTISVLTKADLALKDGKEVFKKRITKLLADFKSSECFIVHGAAENIEDEDAQLATVKRYIRELHLEHTVKIGIEELNNYVENRMMDHVRNKIPLMRNMLHDELHQNDIELNKVGRLPKSPQMIALQDLQAINEIFDDKFDTFQPSFRRFTESMTEKLLTIDMKPLQMVDAAAANKILWSKWNRSTCNRVDDKNNDNHILAMEVKKIGEDSRAMVNTPYVGKQTELEMWLKTISEPLKLILVTYIEEIFDYFYNKIVKYSIQEGSSEQTKYVVSQRLDSVVQRDVIMTAKTDALEYATNLVDSVSKNTYTTNQSNLGRKIYNLKEHIRHDIECINDNDYRISMEQFYYLVCEIKAFISTRKDVLPEIIQLHFTKTLNDLKKETKKKIGNLMMEETSIAMITESPQVISMRKFYLEKEEKIKKTLDEINFT